MMHAFWFIDLHAFWFIDLSTNKRNLIIIIQICKLMLCSHYLTIQACNPVGGSTCRTDPSTLSFLATFHRSVPLLSSSSIHLFILSDLQFGLLLDIFPSSIVSSSDIIPDVTHFQASFSSLVITLLRRSQS